VSVQDGGSDVDVDVVEQTLHDLGQYLLKKKKLILKNNSNKSILYLKILRRNGNSVNCINR